MKISVLKAALQELTPREKRDPDPDLAIEEWLEFSRDIGSPHIELSAAPQPSLSDVSAEVLAAQGMPVQAWDGNRPGHERPSGLSGA